MATPKLLLPIFAFLTVATCYDEAQAQAPAIGTKTEEGRIFLYRNPIENYWDDWSGMAVTSKTDQVDVSIKGEGKTADFDGIVSINCLSESGFYWKTAGNFGESLDEGGINETVPPDVVANAREIFCNQ